MTADTVAVDRDRFVDYLFGFLAGEEVTEERIAAAMSGALRNGLAIELEEYAVAVRHEHGERIAKAIEPRSNGGISRGSVIRLGALDDAARLARELSPEPS